MKRLLLAVVSLLFATSCTLVENILDKFGYEIIWPNKTEQSKQVSKPLPRAVDRVYSYAFDGHLNMRAMPSFNAKIVGKFRNGPQSANLLQDLGGWSKIEYNGIEGYVVSRYLKRTPTIPYTGRVGLSWIEGVWIDSNCYQLRLYNNGYFSHGYNGGCSGYYILQNNEVKCVVVLDYQSPSGNKWTGAKGLPNEEGMIFKIDERSGTLRTLDGSVYCREEFVKYAEGDIEDIWDEVPSKALHRQSGKELAKQVSAYMRK